MPIITATTTATAGGGAGVAIRGVTAAKSPTDYLLLQQQATSLQQQQQQQQPQPQHFSNHFYQQPQQQLAPPNASHQHQHSHLHPHPHPHAHPVAAPTSFATFNGNSNLNASLANGSSRKFNCSRDNVDEAADIAAVSQTLAPAAGSDVVGNGNGDKLAGLPPPGGHHLRPPPPQPAVKKSIAGAAASAAGNSASREDVASLSGTSSLNSQMSAPNHFIPGLPSNGIGGNGATVTGRGGGPPSSILKGSKENLLQNAYYNGETGGDSSLGSECGGGDVQNQHHDDPGDGLGPLPPKWETAYTDRGELYFIDHNTGTSHWLDPRLSKYQKKSLEDCCEDELPYGWEKIEDSMYGMYFIDHVNRRTQYENPVLEAKRRAAEQRQQQQQQQHQQQQLVQEQRSKTPNILPEALPSEATVQQEEEEEDEGVAAVKLPYKFTRNPAELQGQRINTTLVKSSRGLGFTIVGSDGTSGGDVEEFLQIKTVVPNGPAWLDGQLQTGDVLIYVNDTCVLGYTHHDMVNIFQSIMPGERASLEVCRGYPLPFDPNDPNNEVVTTMAVDGRESDKQRRLNMDGNYNFLDLSSGDKASGSGFILMKKPELYTFSIMKGAMGFGFTIADSACGQIVKKILDRNCCTQLMEGDVLLEINGLNVRSKPHFYVVELLKECSLTTPTVVKIQRTPPDQQPTSSNTLTQLGQVGNVAKLRKNFVGSGLFRSKTPTADLYSTQVKEVLPMRPKTPLVDTRRARVQTPSNEMDGGEAGSDAAAIRNGETEARKPLQAKSNHSLQELDDIPYMDPYPKMVSRLSERLAEATLQQGDANGGGIYGLPPSMQPLPLPLVHHESCYCYDCQAQRYRPGYFVQTQQQATGSGQYSPLQTAHLQNERIQRRVNELLSDRRRVGFANLDPPPHHQQQQQQQQPQIQHSPSWRNGALLLDASEDADRCELTEVTLERQALGFGFRIVGGTEEGSQVTVGHIVPGGAADQDQRIATGDEILSIDGINVLNSSHHKVVSLVGESALRGQVTMILRRRRASLLQQVLPLRPYPYDVIVSRHENEGFGFVIISSSNHYYGSTIGKLIPGSPADRCGELKVGDRIVAVNRIEIAGMTHGDVVNLIKESGLHVRLTIGCPLKEGGPSPGGSSAGLGSNTPLQPSPSLMKGPPQPPASLSQQQSQLHHHHHHHQHQQQLEMPMSMPMPGHGGSYLERPSNNIAATLALHQQQPQL